jgi:hypothetical protein
MWVGDKQVSLYYFDTKIKHKSNVLNKDFFHV